MAKSGECLGCFWLEKQLEPGVITTSISSQNYFDITVLSEFDCVSGCQGNKLEKIILKDHHLYGSNRLGYQEYNKALPLNNGNVVTHNFSSPEDIVFINRSKFFGIFLCLLPEKNIGKQCF